jgi:hypothetical protein
VLEVHPLTTRQAAMVARVPVLDVTRARRDSKRANGQSNGRGETLAEHIARSSPAERLEAARSVGVAVIWDTMVAPACGEEQVAGYSASASETALRGVSQSHAQP